MVLPATAAELTFTPSGFIQEVVASGLPWATAIAFAPDGRMFIALQSGVVRVHQDGALLPTPFRAYTADSGERGLLGIAVDPDFPSSLPYVYLLYTWNPPGYPTTGAGARVSRLIRVEADPAQGFNVAKPGSEAPQTEADPGRDPARREQHARPHRQRRRWGRHHEGVMHDRPRHGQGSGRGLPAVRQGLALDRHRHVQSRRLLFVGNGDGSNDVDVDPRALRARISTAWLARSFASILSPGWVGRTIRSTTRCARSATAPRSTRSGCAILPLRDPPAHQRAVHRRRGLDVVEEIDTGKGANFGWPCYEGGALGSDESGNTGSLQQSSYAADAATSTACAALYAQGPAQSARQSSRTPTGSMLSSTAARSTAARRTAQYRNALFFVDSARRWITPSPSTRRVATVQDFGAYDADGIVQVLVVPTPISTW